jgi:hypothetical protein
MVAVLESAGAYFPANASYDDFSNARAPQNGSAAYRILPIIAAICGR